MDFAFYDGSFLPYEEVKIGINDRSFFFGDGIYDVMLGNKNGIYMENEHLSRFFKNLEALSLFCEYRKEDISDILRILLKKCDETMCFLYVQANRFCTERTHTFEKSSPCHLFAYAKKIALPNENQRLSLVSVEDNRYSLCHIKTINLLPNILTIHYSFCVLLLHDRW